MRNADLMPSRGRQRCVAISGCVYQDSCLCLDQPLPVTGGDLRRLTVREYVQSTEYRAHWCVSDMAATGSTETPDDHS